MLIEKLKNTIRGDRQSEEIGKLLTRLHKIEKKIEKAQGTKRDALIEEKHRLEKELYGQMLAKHGLIETRPEQTEVEHRGGSRA